MSDSPLERRIKNSEYEKLFEQEELILNVTESIWEQLGKHEWTKKQLADAIGCSAAHVTQLLNGGRNMTLRTLADIASALQVHVTFELTEKESYSNWQATGEIVRFTPPRHNIVKLDGADWQTEELSKTA